MIDPSGAVVRPVVDSDVPHIHDLITDIYADYQYVLDVREEDPHLINPGDYFRRSGGEFWVVEDRGEIVATCALLVHPEGGELKTVYVRRDHRRQGWGRLLSRQAIGHAIAAGCKAVFLWSDTRFIEAHRMYESLGFVRNGIRHIQCTNTFSEYRYDLPPAEAHPSDPPDQSR